MSLTSSCADRERCDTTEDLPAIRGPHKQVHEKGETRTVVVVQRSESSSDGTKQGGKVQGKQMAYLIGNGTVATHGAMFEIFREALLVPTSGGWSEVDVACGLFTDPTGRSLNLGLGTFACAGVGP